MKNINLNVEMIDRANLFIFGDQFNKCMKQLANKFHTLKYFLISIIINIKND